VAWQRRATASGQQRESVHEALDDLLHGQCSGSHGGELDRERQPIKAPAQIRDRSAVRLAQLEPARGGVCTVYEQRHGFVLAKALERLGVGGRRELERRDWQHVLSRDGERLSARGDDAHARSAAHHRGHDRCGRRKQVLAVVEDEQ
jgi:hypothetical protein